MSFQREIFLAGLLMMCSLLFCTLAIAEEPSKTDASVQEQTTPPPAAPQPQKAASTDDGWRGQIMIYGWFPGIHGTIISHSLMSFIPSKESFRSP
jgi:hypothetical protein